MKTIIKYFKIMVLLLGISGCADYLDIVPDRVATMENAFSNRVNAEKFLFTCYSYLPNPTNVFTYPAMVGGDEMCWLIGGDKTFNDRSGANIARGNQNSNDPYQNYWDGRLDGKNLFVGIRDCNIFLENAHLISDIEDYERLQWISEVKFLKAYYHFFLLQLYGPVPIIRENLPVNATPEEVRVYREPVNEVIDYIVELLDEAVPCLPLETFSNIVNDAGRITQPIALAVKAKALVWAASPLFNGNADYKNFKDNRDRQLIPSDAPDIAKWERAAVAIKNAIDTCHLAGHVMYQYHPPASAGAISDVTKLKYTLRGAVTSKLNPEIVWPATQDVGEMQRWCYRQYPLSDSYLQVAIIGATLPVVEQFYTNNGIPINEDPTWDYANRYETQTVTGDDATFHQYYVRSTSANQATAKLHLYREPRFYAFVCFDRGIHEMFGNNEANSAVIAAKSGETDGYMVWDRFIMTGFFIKKLVNPDLPVTGAYTNKRYSFPLIRLPDLYLLYAEALNEAYGPSPEVYKWIDTIRSRAGLKGVEESWKASSNTNKPYNQEGLRDIIKQERLIELSFEGQRFYDLRRWKDAEKYLNGSVIQGWNYEGMSVDNYYKLTTYVSREFKTPRDYLWPLRLNTLIINSNLAQNPGWK